MNRILLSAALVTGVVGSAAIRASGPAGDDAPRIVARARLDAPPSLGARGFHLGSIFSDLFRDDRDPKGVFWAVTDRGPNGETLRDGAKRRTFGYPDFSPTIVQVRVQDGAIQVTKTIPLRGTNGAPLSGLPNRPGVDEEPWDCSASAVIPRDSAGVDTEGIVRLAGGGFWLSEEYGPSLIRVGADGVVSERLVPRGAGIATHAYRVSETLPPVFSRRVQNRGFESLALSKDQRFLFTSIQSPLAHPLPATAKTSRVARVLKLDADSGTVLGEYVAILEEASVFGASSQSDVKISGAIWVGEDRLLLDQRTDEAAKIYELDLRKATNILRTAWDDLDHESLEAQSPLELSGKGVVAATSKLLLDLSALATNLPVKIEGIALADDRTLVAGNDNEFAFNGCDSAQNAVPVDRPSELLFIRFPHRLR